MHNIIRAFLVLFFFGLLTACGSGGDSSGGNPNFAPITVTMPDPITTPPPPEPVTLGFDSPELGAINVLGQLRSWMVVLSVSTGQSKNILGRTITLTRMDVARPSGFGSSFPDFNRTIFHATGELVPLVENGATIFLPRFIPAIAFEGRPSITAVGQLCEIPWLVTYLNNNFAGGNACPSAGAGISYSPNMPNVLHAVLADGFNRGIGIGESNFAFSGRHNGDDRAAGFTYDMGGYALRTDYVHLPSKQDGGVFLDTYRFGILRPINDETRFFAGVDSYRNAIFAIDTNGENLHRFGIAAGNGYAIKYEFRVRL